MEFSQLFGADDKVVMQGYYCGTNKATGNTFKANATHVFGGYRIVIYLNLIFKFHLIYG
jgi:hypothetical protein